MESALLNSSHDTKIDLTAIRKKQVAWQGLSIQQRMVVLRRFRRLIAQNGLLIAEIVCAGTKRNPAEVVVAEILPMAEACKFLEKRTKTILRTSRLSPLSRPGWLMGVQTSILREPHGVVLILAPYNYPVFLPVTQALQALAAGNAVIIKPGRNGRAVLLEISKLMADAGLPDGLLSISDESIDTAKQLLDSDFNKVVLTGSAATGRAVLRQLAKRAIPATVELSGNDALIVLPDADLDVVARAIAYGLRLNGSQICIAPRRVIIIGDDEALIAAIIERAKNIKPVEISQDTCTRLEGLVEEACKHGAMQKIGKIDPASFSPVLLRDVPDHAEIMRVDIFAPVVCTQRVSNEQQAVAAVNASPYGLGASIFGGPDNAKVLANQLDTGFVTINDIIVPTADPRTAFGGRKNSGYGVTRGAEGLLEMTRPKTIFERKGSFLPHLNPPRDSDLGAYANLLQALHGKGFTRRTKAFMTALKDLTAQLKSDR